MPKVYNKHKNNAPYDAVYIGRGSEYGNPYVAGKHGDRTEVINMFCDYLESKPRLVEKIKSELVSKDLVCYCKPAACHGDIILELANNGRIQKLPVRKSLF